MQKFFKVYEILDNVSETMEVYPKNFVGAFMNEEMAKSLCINIDIADCNSTKIVVGFITKADVEDLKNYGLKGADKSALGVISKMLNQSQQENVR